MKLTDEALRCSAARPAYVARSSSVLRQPGSPGGASGLGVQVGTEYEGCAAMYLAGVHRCLKSGVTGNEDYKFGEGSDTLDIFFDERYGNATKIQSFADIVEGMPRGSTSRLR